MGIASAQGSRVGRQMGCGAKGYRWSCPDCRKKDIDFCKLFMQLKLEFMGAKKLLEAVMVKFKQSHEMFKACEFLESASLFGVA